VQVQTSSSLDDPAAVFVMAHIRTGIDLLEAANNRQLRDEVVAEAEAFLRGEDT
jgi:hypothetical protein